MHSSSAPFLFGVTSYEPAPFTLSIPQISGAMFTMSIIQDVVDPPSNVLAAHVGAGNVVVAFDYPMHSVDYFEVFISDQISGDYVRWGRSTFKKSPLVLNNIPLGVSAFIRVRSVSNDGTVSDWTQAKRGVLGYPEVLMKCIAPSGSIIPSGTVFTCKSPERDRLLAFESQEEIMFQF